MEAVVKYGSFIGIVVIAVFLILLFFGVGSSLRA